MQQWDAAVKEKVKLPEGYFLRFEGEFQAQQAAAKRIAFYFALVLIAITVLLYSYFRSLSLALQVMLNIPLALMGGLGLTWLLINNISIATIVGFIAVGGVAARNGIMMISHYLHLMKHEGEGFTRQMIVRGTLERLVPVLMTALAAGIALIPLLLAANEPGKEILHPVAVVIVGGLVSSTLLDLMVTPAVFYLFGRKAAFKYHPNPHPPMKTKLILLTLISTLTFAHEGVELGPNGGRIVEFSKNETMHGEVLVKGDKFHIALLDKDMKPVAIAEQTLTATTGDRTKALPKLTVEKDAKGFVVPS